MSLRQKLALAISRRLCPDVHRDQLRYEKLWRGLDEARWWLGQEFPEASSLAHRLLDEDQYYWTSEKPMRRPEWTWQAPSWVVGIPTFREWLRSKPFNHPAPADRSEGGR